MSNGNTLHKRTGRRFSPCQTRIEISTLAKIPRTPEGDRQLWDALLSMTTLSEQHVNFVLQESAKRPAIYEDLHRLVLQHRPLSRLRINWLSK
jgi:hypothetical protein